MLAVCALSAGCAKEKKDDAAPVLADAAVEVAVVAAAADAAVAAAEPLLDAATAPLATVKAAPKVVKPVSPPDPPICAIARSAKKRESPAAAGLEAQCKAAGGTP